MIERTHTLIEAAEGVLAADNQPASVAADLESIVSASHAHLAALGEEGQADAVPSAPGGGTGSHNSASADDGASTVSASASPSASTESAKKPTAKEVVKLLHESMAHARTAAADPAASGEEATLYASIANYRYRALLVLSADLDEPTPKVKLSAALPKTFTDASKPLCRLFDALGYGEEMRAARSEGKERKQAAGMAEQYRDLAGEIARRGGFESTPADPREISYTISGSLAHQLATWRSALTSAWLAQVAPASPADRALVLDQLLTLGKTSVAEASSAPADAKKGPLGDPFPGLKN